MPAMLQLQLVLRLLANTTRIGEVEARRLWSTAHHDAEAERMQLQPELLALAAAEAS